MRLFLDTANLDDIQWGLTTGLIDGVTTNPSLIARELADGDPTEHVTAIARAVSGPVTVQVISSDADGMYREARDLARIGENIVVEIPMVEDGIVAMKRLVPEGAAVNMTLVFTAAQALLAAKAGASYVSPFIGRLDDAGGDGGALVADIRAMFDRFAPECEILASSVRSPRRLVDAVKLGADAVAVPPSVLRAMLLHPLTDLGLQGFLRDWGTRLGVARSDT
ncbi:MAG TPA: fructose-6-phosphate aldolase [Gemmatimonadaceae bacterium]|nr:fructose-6-phosphate aldolase [Gemmatimonadaceae bacterium]